MTGFLCFCVGFWIGQDAADIIAGLRP